MKNSFEAIKVDDSGMIYTLAITSGKYKMAIMFWLWQTKIIRFNALKRCIRQISYKTLSTALKELEKDGIICRTEYPQVPPKVEYSLTERGVTLIPILSAMCSWGFDNKDQARFALR